MSASLRADAPVAAYVCHVYGNPPDVRLDALPRASALGDDEVLIEVVYAAFNFFV